jgi:hypothetical protein
MTEPRFHRSIWHAVFWAAVCCLAASTHLVLITIDSEIFDLWVIHEVGPGDPGNLALNSVENSDSDGEASVSILDVIKVFLANKHPIRSIDNNGAPRGDINGFRVFVWINLPDVLLVPEMNCKLFGLLGDHYRIDKLLVNLSGCMPGIVDVNSTTESNTNLRRFKLKFGDCQPCSLFLSRQVETLFGLSHCLIGNFNLLPNCPPLTAANGDSNNSASREDSVEPHLLALNSKLRFGMVIGCLLGVWWCAHRGMVCLDNAVWRGHGWRRSLALSIPFFLLFSVAAALSFVFVFIAIWH